MTERIAGLGGKLPQRQGGDRFAIAWSEDYMGAAPAPTYPIDVSAGITGWLMLGNGPDPTLTVYNGQPVGDCVVAAWKHDTMIAIKLGHLPEAEPTADQTVTLYLQYSHGQDNGVVIADFLLWLYQQKLILGFAPVNPASVDAVMAQVGRGLITGVELTDDAQQLFQDGQPWTTANGETPDPQNGHAILKVKSQSGSGTGTFVSWGQDQAAEGPWIKACASEFWLILTPEDRASMDAATWTRLVGDLDALPAAHGPAPAPAPAPAPTPSHAPPRPPRPPHPLPPTLLGWWEDVLLWIKLHLG